MRLRAWRETWMWLALGACGAPAWISDHSGPQVSVFETPPLAQAKYVAIVGKQEGRGPPPAIEIERGSFQCQELLRLLQDGTRCEYDAPAPCEAAQRTCDLAVGKLLRDQTGFVLVVDGTGPRWRSGQELLAAALPVDTPAKALLAVWVTGTYDVAITNGRVRAVKGGFEVVGESSSTDGDCGVSPPRVTVTNYRNVIFVDAKGSLRVRDKWVTDRYNVADPCHPHGRRPEGFADVTTRGWLRAMHHEAESVRAFERIARELLAYGAPSELCQAAEQAARDERDHAERCARLAGTRATIARDELPVRSLVDFAIDNASEGCVGESYAALIATTQAQTTFEPDVRAHHVAIAADELTHAALAYAIAEWLDGKLTAEERARVRAERDASLVALAAAPDVEIGLLSAVAGMAALTHDSRS